MSWLSRITSGLKKSAASLTAGLKSAVGLGASLTPEVKEKLEESLLAADVGLPATTALIKALEKAGVPEPLTEENLKQALAPLIAARLPKAQPLELGKKGLTTIMVAGVNGSGKTTTIGKLAAQLSGQGHKVVIAAADTFRAAATQQLQVWAKRADVEIITKPDADPASVAYMAQEHAQKAKATVLLIDTAGRLPNRADLLAELEKIPRVLQKLNPQAPQHTVLVLDGTLGQATLKQVEDFSKATPITGLIVTKLDGSAKAGFLLALAEKFPQLPVHALGFGEQLEDLGPYQAEAFARALLDL
ncbi:MAG: signal recognition particle-docking protein FtsY [Proteobacteria bacterium]|nr:signal recognition particle-docking protein FtsY [Pseudomonadota bacterium]NBX86313.1 signal recognition particle-docking protein FtsY [Pseudomonadota bacterium]